MQHSKLIYAALHQAFKFFFSLYFKVDWDEVPLQLHDGTHIDIQDSEYMESSFLACHILDFYKNTRVSIWMIC